MASADHSRITYRFHLPQGIKEIALDFDSDSFELRLDPAKRPQQWTRLDFHQCPHCPLTPDSTPLCPFAQALSRFVATFDEFFSYEKAVIEIVTDTRTVVGNKPLQHGMASLVGLIGATSGCPHLAFFRPMARFHLPFARDDETLFRVFSMHLLREYLAGRPLVAEVFDELSNLNRAATQVNRAMADRVRAAFHKDVVVNAIIVLDSFAQAVPYVIEDKLDELRMMFGLAPAETA